MNAPGKLWSLKELMAYLNISRPTVYLLLAEDGLPGYKLRGQWRFRAKDIDDWLEHRKYTDAVFGPRLIRTRRHAIGG